MVSVNVEVSCAAGSLVCGVGLRAEGDARQRRALSANQTVHDCFQFSLLFCTVHHSGDLQLQ